MKIIIIGLNHAGCAAARTLINLGQTDITIYDRSLEVSFLACGMALWIGGQLSSGQGLFYASAKDFVALGAKVMTETMVDTIDFDRKYIQAHTKSGQTVTDTYDRLILATGSRPKMPNIPGLALDNIINAKTFRDAERAVTLLAKPDIRRVAVIGAGYIGIELAEACRRQGKEVTLIDSAPRIMNAHADEKFSNFIAEQLTAHGIRIETDLRITEFEGDSKLRSIRTTKGSIPADLAFACMGFEPCTELAQGKLELGPKNAFKVDKNQRTSRPDVFAIGDCATIYNNAIDAPDYIALASNAIRTGIIAAFNAAGIDLPYPGAQGSSGLCIYDMKLLTTGLSLQAAKEHHLDVSFIDVDQKRFPDSHSGPNPTVHMRLVYRNDDRVLIGAQIASKADLSGAIHMLSLAIQTHLTIDALAYQDIFLMPEVSGLNAYRKAALSAGYLP